jgi:hypothetical protein
VKVSQYYSTIAVIIAGFAFIAYLSKDSVTLPKGRPVDSLVARLENYRRSIARNDYSINYEARGSESIVIKVTHYPGVNMRVMNGAVESAKSVVEGIAKEIPGLESITVDVEVKVVDAPAP